MSSNTMEPIDSDTVAFAFPGVGVKLCGRETSFYKSHLSIMKPYLDEASEGCHLNLAEALLKGTVDTTPDGISQFFSYSFCAGAYHVFKSRGVVPSITAGFSFGIYAALYAAESISFRDGLKMLQNAYLLMEEESHGKEYGMGIVVGLKKDEISALLKENKSGTVCVVNSSNDTCYLLSGTKPELREMIKRAMAREAYSAELLEVDIAYHHPILLGEVSSKFKEFIHGLEWTNPACPVVSSIDQTFLRTASELQDFAARNLTTPINWKNVVTAMEQAGITHIVECGPGVSLTQNGRFISTAIAYTNIKKARRWLAR